MPRLLGLILLLALAPAAASGQATQAETNVAETAAAQADTAVAPKTGNTVVFPVLGYTPDTGALVGATVLRFFYLDQAPDARPSVISPVAIYTFKNQVLFFLGTDLNWGAGRWHASLVPSYQKFPDDFYGFGREVPKDPLESYTPEQFAFDGMIERETLGELRLGVRYRVASHRILEAEAGGAIDSGLVPGATTSVVSGPGLQLAWDTRDNTWSPRTGRYGQAGTTFYRDGFGSDFRWTEYSIDLRTYREAGDRGTLAGQLMFTSGDGDMPFYRMPRLGGQNGLRGYSGGRFLERTMIFGRLAWRSGPVLGRFGGVVFAGLGDVASTPGRLTAAANLYTVGAGLRFLLNPEQGVNIRLDYGLGNDDSGFYLSLGEAF
jgi:outer membrane protein assembly factor BamA